jgi:hypothetical protein
VSIIGHARPIGRMVVFEGVQSVQRQEGLVRAQSVRKETIH